MGYGAGLKQAYSLRDVAAAEAIALLAQPKPDNLADRCRLAMAAASLSKVWESACERIRIARGQPLPGSRRPGPSKPARQPRQSRLSPDQS